MAARRLAIRRALRRALPARTDGARHLCVSADGRERSRRSTTLPSSTDDVGIIQHALEYVPNRKTGYCTDDVSRAFIVALRTLRLAPNDRQSQRLASIYLAFLQHAQLDDGRFHNFMEYDRRWCDESARTTAAAARSGRSATAWPMRRAQPWRRVCATLLDRAVPALGSLDYLRSRAYAALGLAQAYAAIKEQRYARALRYARARSQPPTKRRLPTTGSGSRTS